MRVASFIPSFAINILFANIVLLLGLSSAQDETASPSSTAPSVISQPILHPAKVDVPVPGSIFKIQWTANPHFRNITIQLWDKTSWGYSRDLLQPCYRWPNPFCGTIGSHVPNTGSFDWQVPDPATGMAGSGFPRGQRVFWIKMFVDDYVHEEIGNTDPVVSYGQNFAFAGQGGESQPAMLESESPTETPAPDKTPAPTETVYVTVDESTSVLGATSVLKTPSVTATGASNGTGMQATPSPGVATRSRGNVLGALLLLLRFV